VLDAIGTRALAVAAWLATPGRRGQAQWLGQPGQKLPGANVQEIEPAVPRGTGRPPGIAGGDECGGPWSRIPRSASLLSSC